MINDRLVHASRCEAVDATPVWFMRQAGRSFAAYRQLRERYGILELAKTPDLCAQVTLMPVHELGVDAAVLFADIMLPLEPMGINLRIEPEVGPIMRAELGGTAAVIGFSGAPFTLACYLIEGRPSRDFAIAKAFMYREPAAWHDLMDRLASMIGVYLRAQVEAGADVVQVFDSWVGGLGPADYATFVQPHVRRIFDGLAGIPSIHFGTGTAALLELMADAGGDVIGVDHRQSLSEAWRRVGYDRGVQGNLDAARLLAGWEATEAGARIVLAEAAGRAGHIFNLGHGVLPATDTGLLRRLVDLVHEETSRRPVAMRSSF